MLPSFCHFLTLHCKVVTLAKCFSLIDFTVEFTIRMEVYLPATEVFCLELLLCIFCDIIIGNSGEALERGYGHLLPIHYSLPCVFCFCFVFH